VVPGSDPDGNGILPGFFVGPAGQPEGLGAGQG